jgi:hypothetical protein
MPSGYIEGFDLLFDVSITTLRVSQGKIDETLSAALPL